MTKQMHSSLIKWLEELEEEIEIVASGEIGEKAHANMVSFGFNEELLNDWGENSVSEFLASCADLYKRKSIGLGVVFYLWLDEPESHIRMSAVSQIHGKLPFRCKISQASLARW
jgi:hypothetical protein